MTESKKQSPGARDPAEAAGGEPTVVGGKVLSEAFKNTRLGLLVSLACLLISVGTMVATTYIVRYRNHVVAMPAGKIWDYPMVHWRNAINRYEDEAKPLYVAMKYVRGLYEADPLDFVEYKSDGSKVMLSSRVSDLLAYTIPGTEEFLNVSQKLRESQAVYANLYEKCRCMKRFAVFDMMITQLPGEMRVELIGRYFIFGQDGRRPTPASDLGMKSIVINLVPGTPLVDKNNNIEGTNVPLPMNPEGWYVLHSSIQTMSKENLNILSRIRGMLGMKARMPW